jgi:hypothetical protein
LDAKSSKEVSAANSQAAQAESAEKMSNAKSVQDDHSVYMMAAAFIVLLIVSQKTPQGRAFKERMSGKISGIVGRTNDKKKPLLDKGKVVSPFDAAWNHAVGA